MKALTLSELRRGKGPIWVLNGGHKSSGYREYGEVIIEIRDSSAKAIRNLNDWLRGTSHSQRQEVVDNLGVWMQKRTSERGAEFVSGKTRPIDTADQMVAAVENNEPVAEIRHLTLPQTWLPMCVTNEFKRKLLLSNQNFTRAIKDGKIVPISEEDALAMLASQDATRELERLDKQREARAAVDNVVLVMDPARMAGNLEMSIGTPRSIADANVEIRGPNDWGMERPVPPTVGELLPRPVARPITQNGTPEPRPAPEPQRKWWHVLLFWR